MSGKIGSIFGGPADMESGAAASEKPAGEEATVSFEASQKPAAAPQDAGFSTADEPHNYQTYLGAGCVIEGRVVCKGPTRFGGNVNGEIVADGLIAIDEGASVTANLDVHEAFIEGHMHGNITAVGRVCLSPTAVIDGDIRTPSLLIREGAQVKGKVEVSPNISRPTQSSPAPVAPAEAQNEEEKDAMSA